MVDKSLILKSFDTAIIKCSNSSEKAKSRGTGGVRKKNGSTYEITYGDGTKIVFKSSDHSILSVTIDGEEYHYDGTSDYDNVGVAYEKFAEYQGQQLFDGEGKGMEWIDDVWYSEDSEGYDTVIHIDSHWIDATDDYDFVSTYATQYATLDGMRLNSMLYTGTPLITRREDSESYDGVIFNKANHDYFVKLERQSKCDYDNIIAVRYTDGEFHESESLDKESYTAKAHTGFTAGGYQPVVKDSFGGVHEEDTYTIINIIHQGSGDRGLFLGNNINTARGQGSDWEGELNIPPNTRFTRDLIDEDNRIIIQHISSQRGV